MGLSFNFHRSRTSVGWVTYWQGSLNINEQNRIRAAAEAQEKKLDDRYTDIKSQYSRLDERLSGIKNFAKNPPPTLSPQQITQTIGVIAGDRCPATARDAAFVQAKRISGLRDRYLARIDQITREEGEVRRAHATNDGAYNELVIPLELAKREAKTDFFQNHYVKEYRTQAIEARDAILSKFIVLGSGLGDLTLDDKTVPYEYPSGPDDLSKIKNDLERLATACSEK